MNFEESYLGIIIDTYEREAMKSGSPKALKLMAMKSVSDMQAVSHVAVDSVSKFPGSSFNFDEDPESAKSTNSGSVDAGLLAAAGLGLDESTGKIFTDYLTKCFGCDLRINLSWQLLPPEGLLSSFESMFDGVLDALQQLAAIAKPSAGKAAEICALIKLFDPMPLIGCLYSVL
jgi:hypothetical protein